MLMDQFLNSNSLSPFIASLDLNVNPDVREDELVVPTKEYLESDEFMELQRILSQKPNHHDELQLQTGELVVEMNRVSLENQKLTQMITVMCDNYNSLRKKMVDYYVNDKKRKADEISNNNNNNNGNINLSENSSTEDNESKRPRVEEDPADDAIRATKISKVYVKTEPSDTSLIVKDGYHWRKYGQKVTRNNPSPRAYYKCSFAPDCPVKKKVQRSVEDQSVVVATYEGEHTHPMDAATSSNGRSVTNGVGGKQGGSPITMNLIKPMASGSNEGKLEGMMVEPPQPLQHSLVEHMASSLSKDPKFTAAVAAAISGTMQGQISINPPQLN